MSRRPNLTDAELERLADLTEEQGLTPTQIAAELGCSLGSVTWAQLKIGVDGRADKPLAPIPTEPKSAIRNGHLVRRYTQSDDALLLRLESQGMNPHAIGKAFQPPRRANSIVGRLRTLARRQAREEMQARMRAQMQAQIRALIQRTA